MFGDDAADIAYNELLQELWEEGKRRDLEAAIDIRDRYESMLQNFSVRIPLARLRDAIRERKNIDGIHFWDYTRVAHVGDGTASAQLSVNNDVSVNVSLWSPPTAFIRPTCLSIDQILFFSARQNIWVPYEFRDSAKMGLHAEGQLPIVARADPRRHDVTIQTRNLTAPSYVATFMGDTARQVDHYRAFRQAA